MAKRSRRSRKMRARKQNVARKTEPTPARTKADSPPVQAGPSFSGEYKYVVTDLRRVAILAAAIFALLVALSFFIQ